MATYGQFWQTSAVDQAKVIEACGDRSVIILDSRRHIKDLQVITAETCRERGYRGYSVLRGRNLLQAETYIQYMPINMWSLRPSSRYVELLTRLFDFMKNSMYLESPKVTEWLDLVRIEGCMGSNAEVIANLARLLYTRGVPVRVGGGTGAYAQYLEKILPASIYAKIGYGTLPEPAEEPPIHASALMQIAGAAVLIDDTGVVKDPGTVGWLTAARVWSAMEKVRLQECGQG